MNHVDHLGRKNKSVVTAIFLIKFSGKHCEKIQYSLILTQLDYFAAFTIIPKYSVQTINLQ